MMNALLRSSTLKPLPNWLVNVQCICFSILFAIWILPETILIRHVCLVLGGALSLYVIFCNRNLLFTRAALPLYLLLALLVWVVFHLSFLSRDPDLQWIEFTTIWKRSAIGLIFAIGMGLSLAAQSIYRPQQVKRTWWIFYLGLALPTLIFWLKYLASSLTHQGSISPPDFLLLYYSSSKYYIHKSSYVFFCLPLLAVSLGSIFQMIKSKAIYRGELAVYLLGISAALLNFIVEKDRNGEIYSLLLLLIFFALLAKDYVLASSLKSKMIGLVVFLIPLFIGFHQLKSNEYWNNLLSDAYIAIQIDRYDHWQDTPTKGLPVNDQGKMLTGSNYERFAWMHVALRLVNENPLGYGLVERSFGYLSQKRWPNSTLTQSHSGWLDFTLGLGIPGTLLLLGAGILTWLAAKQQNLPWKAFGRWGIAVLLLLPCTTEVSQRVYIDALIFMIALSAAMNIAMAAHQKNRA